MRIQDDTGGYIRIHKDTGGYRRKQKNTGENRRIQEETGGYMRIQKIQGSNKTQTDTVFCCSFFLNVLLSFYKDKDFTECDLLKMVHVYDRGALRVYSM